MKNQEIAQIFYETADYLAAEEPPFRSKSYQKAGLILESLDKDIETVYQKGGKKALMQIPGVGKGLAEKIEEYIRTGRIAYYERLKKKTPFNLKDIIRVEGMGPRRARTLYQKLGIRTLTDLEKAAKTHKIAGLFGFGEKTEQNILDGIVFLKRDKGRFLLGEILPKAREIEQRLKELKEVKEISLAGSLRRKMETVADIDILAVSSSPEKVMNFFVSLPGVVKVWGKGRTRSSVRLKPGFDVDLRVVDAKSYGSALQYFTGSKEHNIATRRLAIDKGLKLNEYGIFRGKNRIAGRTEKEVYKALGLPFLEPELRECRGELEAALSGELPKLIDYGDIRGDLHCHSSWARGANSSDELARRALLLGYEYLGISDHTKFLRIERGLDERELSLQRKEIDKLNVRYQTTEVGIKILQGAETNILNDGSIDVRDDALRKLDYVIAGVHSNFKMTRNRMTERIIRAMKNPYIKIISHPTGRLLKRRDEYQIDLDRILRAAGETKTLLEINAFPERLDLNDQNIKRARESGVRMIINTDAHQKEQMTFMELGVSQARRGWAEQKDIINTQSLKKLLAYFR